MSSTTHAATTITTTARSVLGALAVSALCAMPVSPAVAEEAKKEEAKKVEVESINPLSGDEEAIAVGGKLYFKWCVACHGAKADGVSRFGAYAGDLTKFWRGYPEFIVIVANGRPKKQMPPWKGVLSDVEISQIAAYLETVAVEGANWGVGR